MKSAWKTAREPARIFVATLWLCVLGSLGWGTLFAPPAAAESDTPTEMRSIEITDPRVAEGRALFNICQSCHGPEAEGRTGIGPALNSTSFLAAASDRFLMETIREGRTGTTMVPWKASLRDEQIEAIVAYLRSLNPTPPAELDEQPLAGDLEAGDRVFGSICSGCHGRSGAGYMETSNGTGIGRAAFLEKASNGYMRHIIRNGKSGTAMRAFSARSKIAVANLSDAEIDGVIAYLRANAW